MIISKFILLTDKDNILTKRDIFSLYKTELSEKYVVQIHLSALEYYGF